MFNNILSEFIKLIMAIIQATGHAFSSAYTAMANSISAFFTSIHTHIVLPVANAIHIALTSVFSAVSTVAITLFQTCILPVITFVNQVVSSILYATNIAIRAIASLAFKIGKGVVYAIQYCALTIWQHLVMPVANAIAETKAKSLRDLGTVMGALKSRYSGRMDVCKAGAEVRNALN